MIKVVIISLCVVLVVVFGGAIYAAAVAAKDGDELNSLVNMNDKVEIKTLKLNRCPNCKTSFVTMSNFVSFPDRWIIECCWCHLGIVIDGEKNAIDTWNNLSKEDEDAL